MDDREDGPRHFDYRQLIPQVSIKTEQQLVHWHQLLQNQALHSHHSSSQHNTARQLAAAADLTKTAENEGENLIVVTTNTGLEIEESEIKITVEDKSSPSPAEVSELQRHFKKRALTRINDGQSEAEKSGNENVGEPSGEATEIVVEMEEGNPEEN